ncbi:esterase/lipase family protein [Bacillus bombysepticus]
MPENINYYNQNGNPNLVIFIHGFTGGLETWEYNEECSFPKLLMENKIVRENFDIACFNYYSNVIDFYQLRKIKNGLIRSLFKNSVVTKRNLSIEGLRDILNTYIKIECKSYRNIIFIAHSMGGLVVKSSILELIQDSVDKVKLFISLAVPHIGTEWATFGKVLFQGHSQIINLAPLSDTLDDITRKWLDNISLVPQTIYFSGKHDEVVKENSAIGYGIGKSQVYYYDTDHYMIAKPDSIDNLVYKGVVSELEKFLYTNSGLGDKWKSNVGQLYYINVPRLSELAGYLGYNVNSELAKVNNLNSLGYLGHIILEFRDLINKIEPRALSFNDLELEDIKVGYLVEFNSIFRSKNWSSNKYKLFKKTYNPLNEPHLWKDYNGYKLVLGLSPKWVTTDTAFSSLANSAEVAGLCRIKEIDLVEKVIYATPLFIGIPKNRDFFESLFN